MKSAVAFIVFNRPECTARTLAAIREARPPRLLVIADGPREHRQDDTEKCSAVRKLINDGIDWPCQVELNYEVQNMGCAARVSSGLTWAFSRSEALIVIEDDCLPAPSFFWFCDDVQAVMNAINQVHIETTRRPKHHGGSFGYTAKSM